MRYKTHHDASQELKRFFTADYDKKKYLAELLDSSASTRRALYIHVPFCNKICSFCPFTKLNSMRRGEYDKYLTDRLDRLSRYKYMQTPVESVYFGGGTPTTLSPLQMDKVLKTIRKRFTLSGNCEISLESSISELTDDMLSVLNENGVNRLSLGVQTFDNDTRKLLNRRGSGENAIERIHKIIESGITNTSIDLIYNYPRQTLAHLSRDLEIIKELKLAGISFYSLMLHEKTPLYARLSREDMDILSDLDREYEFFLMILNELGAEGYEIFELTKLIRNNMDRYDYMRIRHERGSCIAVGYGAGGNLDRYFYHNSEVPDISEDIVLSSRGRIVDEGYSLIDQFIFHLQMGSISLKPYSEALQIDLTQLFRPVMEELCVEEYITLTAGGFNLTQKGLFWGNNIIHELVNILLKEISSSAMRLV